MAVDAITLARAARGDRDAQADLLARVQDLWFRYCCSQLRDPELARDATQETAFRVLRDLTKFGGRSTFETWSIGIALNVCRELRRKKGRLGDSIEDEAYLPASGDPGPGELSDAADDQRRLHELLATLPQRQREAVVLRFFEDLSVEDAAAAMNCAEGTVKATVFQALRSLRTKLTGKAEP